MYRFVPIFWLISVSAFSQIRITVSDHTSGKKLDGATVIAQFSDQVQTIIADEHGNAVFTNVSFPLTVTASYIGFDPNGIEILQPGNYSVRLIPVSVQLNDVVVTGQLEPQSVSRSVVKVKTISAETIQAKGATRLQDVLNTDLNIRFSMDPALGVSTLSMQGLSGQNVKVLIDGIPVTGRQGTSNAVDINQLNINSIDRIEIVEGPMSTIYGADALAGVINIITKKPEGKKFTGSVRLHEENIGNEYSFFKEGIHQESIRLGYRGKAFYSLVDFGHNYSGGWQGDSTGREKQWHPKRQWVGSVVAGIDQTDWNVSYRLDYLNEDLYDPEHFSGNEANERHYITNRFMHQLQGAVTLNEKLSYNGAFAYTDYSRQTQAIVVDRQTGEVALALTGQELTEFTSATFRGTLLYKYSNKFSVQPGYDINLESGTGERLRAGMNRIGDYAGFLSAEIKPVSFITVRPGLRFVYNSVYQAPPVLPSLNIRFDVSSRHDLRLSYGRGFRAPSLRELYFYFHDSNHQVEGNPELEAELSHSFNASWNWKVLSGPVSYQTSLNGFYNHIENMIASALRPNTTVSSYFNLDTYKTQGLTLTNALQVRQFKMTAGVAYTGRYNQLITSDRSLPEFTWSPEANASLEYEFPRAGVTANVYYKYTGKTPYYQQYFGTNPPTNYLAETEAYHWADVSVQKTFLKHLSLVLGIHNLCDVTSVRSNSVTGGVHTSGNNSLASGRSYYLTLTANF